MTPERAEAILAALMGTWAELQEAAVLRGAEVELEVRDRLNRYVGTIHFGDHPQYPVFKPRWGTSIWSAIPEAIRHVEHWQTPVLFEANEKRVLVSMGCLAGGVMAAWNHCRVKPPGYITAESTMYVEPPRPLIRRVPVPAAKPSPPEEPTDYSRSIELD